MSREFYGQVVDLLERNHTIAIATLVETDGSTPREGGAKMVVLPDGTIRGTIGGGALERMVTEEAVAAIGRGEGFFREYDLVGKEKGGIGSMCGGRAKVLVEIIRMPDRLLICGGGHIGKVLADMAVSMGFQVWVVDPREEFADGGRFDDKVTTVHADPASKEVGELVTRDTYVVILTHEHTLDMAALRNLAPREAAYVGMIGSKGKVRKIMDALEAEGMDPDVLKGVHAPIGLDIAAETPAEIAVSILGEIVHVRRKGGPSPISMKQKGK